MNNILKAWNAGMVKRWHCNPQLCDSNDYDSGHQQRCTILLLLFWPDATREQIIDMLTHDQGEIDAGDMSYVVKRKHPEFSSQLQVIEVESIQNQGLPVFVLDPEDYAKRKWLDMLDSYMWMLRNKPTMRHKKEWEVQNRLLWSNAEKFNVIKIYQDFMTAALEFYAD